MLTHCSQIFLKYTFWYTMIMTCISYIQGKNPRRQSGYSLYFLPKMVVLGYRVSGWDFGTHSFSFLFVSLRLGRRWRVLFMKRFWRFCSRYSIRSGTKCGISRSGENGGYLREKQLWLCHCTSINNSPQYSFSNWLLWRCKQTMQNICDKVTWWNTSTA